MRAQIEIGRNTEGQAVPIDIEKLLGTRLLVQGNSGSGKSHLLRRLFAPAAAGEMAEDTRRLTLSAKTNPMCRGRKRGLAGVVATQRLAKLAKNVAAEASNFLMGRTFLDIDMQRAADLLGMDRRQAERIRDLQRGQFLGLGPAISRRPVAVHVGDAQKGGKNAAGQGLMPLPETGGEELESLLHVELAQEALGTTRAFQRRSAVRSPMSNR